MTIYFIIIGALCLEIIMTIVLGWSIVLSRRRKSNPAPPPLRILEARILEAPTVLPSQKQSYRLLDSRTIIPARHMQDSQQVVLIEKGQGFPYWQSQGWEKKGKTYQGYYKVGSYSFEGKVEEVYKGHLEFWIKNPPIANTSHPHEACYFLKTKKGGWCMVHFEPDARPPDIDSGIIDIERVQGECLRRDY